ncbi:MAG: starch-binding protein [Lachnospiraceae bacterium]|nr:starch-binding protein [Lachnospiraceae bacterium]
MKKKTIYTLSILLFVTSLGGCIFAYNYFMNGNNPLGKSNTVKKSIGDSSTYKLAKEVSNGVIIQAWCWSFNTITEHMEELADCGYSAIQTSPINECVVGGKGAMTLNGVGKWYYHYQPTDWTIGNYQLGTEEEFAAMCKEADKYGIHIIVDVVPNHTGPETSVNKNLLTAAGGLDMLYHSTGRNNIGNYGDRLQCTMCAMGGLIDVNTENPSFQDYFIKFLNKAIDYGVDGFRYDTAKHIALPDDPELESRENNFWTRVTTEIHNADKIFNYGEVLQGDNERLKDYNNMIGATTASAYGSTMRSASQQRSTLASSYTNYNASGIDPSRLVTWVESHDNYINDGNHKMNDDAVIYGWVILSATGQTVPLFYSRPYGNSSNDRFGTLNRIGVSGNNSYKDPRVIAANRFHNATIGQPSKLVNLDSNRKILAIERGTVGTMIINGSQEDYTVNAVTTLTDDTYVDKLGQTATFTVSNGKLNGVVPASSIVVLCNSKNYVTKDYPATVDVPENTSFSFTEDTISLKLLATNCKESTYSINDGKEISFSDGDSITLGDDLKDDLTIDLCLRGYNNDGVESVRRFVFTKKINLSKGDKIYFKAPSNWEDTIYAYVYDDSINAVKQNNAFPGELMEEESNGLYCYTFTKDFDTGKVVFSDGTNRYPDNNVIIFAEPDKTYEVK